MTPVRLVDLDPSWVRSGAGRSGMGITFQCPLHPGGGCYQGVWFSNPIDSGPPYPGEPGKDPPKLWKRTGTTFDTLRLSPSIHVYNTDEKGNRTTTHWHGHIGQHVPGEVT